MMQLDDVVSSTVTGPRVEEAMHRSIRWLDRCIAANKNPNKQNLFAIIQGGLNADLRKACLDGKTSCSEQVILSPLLITHLCVRILVLTSMKTQLFRIIYNIAILTRMFTSHVSPLRVSNDVYKLLHPDPTRNDV